ncbi:MAG: flagellar basal body P-ring formation protein FlgA [Xanthobacteraceae bacterium]|nr:flagellar basal body P-ring formation protein FlgA [Xanthobacteraceae bacterium]
MSTTRSVLSVLALCLCATSALAEQPQGQISGPSLRDSVTVTSEVVKIGDLVDNAGIASGIAIYRAPDLGTTGTLRTAQLLEILRANDVIGVDTHNLKEVSITRASRPLSAKYLEGQVAHALEHRYGLGDAANLSLNFDRELRDLQLDPSYGGDLIPVVIRYDGRTNRFNVIFDVANDETSTPAKLQFTGTALDTVEAAVLTRALDRGEIIKTADVTFERRPRSEFGNDVALRNNVIGMQTRRALRAGQGLKTSDLAKTDLITRDQAVTLIYETPGLYLTGRGKATEAGKQGDVINVLNLQSKRTVQGVIVGPGQVSVTINVPTPTTVAAVDPATPLSSANAQTPAKAE